MACIVLWSILYKEQTMTIPIEKVQGNVIDVSDIEFKFEDMTIFSGSGGLGAVPIKFDTAKKFENKTRDEEIYKKISLSIQPDSFGDTNDTYTETYISFKKYTTGVFVYEKEYFYPGYIIKDWDENNLYLQSSNSLILCIVTPIYGFIAIWFLFFFVRKRYHRALFGEEYEPY